jgi:hypothetical protein
MILLDILSGLELVGYLIAIRFESIPIVHVSTMFRSGALGAAYYPIKMSILPMLIPLAIADERHVGDDQAGSIAVVL